MIEGPWTGMAFIVHDFGPPTFMSWGKVRIVGMFLFTDRFSRRADNFAVKFCPAYDEGTANSLLLTGTFPVGSVRAPRGQRHLVLLQLSRAAYKLLPSRTHWRNGACRSHDVTYTGCYGCQ